MAKILVLKPDDEKRVHPYALKRLSDWRAEILHDIPQLDQLEIDEINADVNAQLNEDERARARKCIADVMEYLKICMDIGDGYSPYPYSTWVIQPMSELKSLLKKVYQCKEEKAETEHRKKEEEERRHAAYITLEPPLKDAKLVLDAEEYKEFERRIDGAVDACLAKGEDYLSDIRAIDYEQWCTTINRRREEKERKTVAERKSWKFNRLLNEEIERLRSILHLEEQNPEGYFEKMIVDLRYTGQSFVHLLSPDVKRGLDTDIDGIVRRKLNKLLPRDFCQFIDWEYQVSYFLLPWADYSLKGVACLDFNFDVFAVVQTKVWLKPEQKSFDGYMFTLPQIEHKVDAHASYFIELKEPEFLGYHYLVPTPSMFGGYVFLQTIPLVLIRALMEGNPEPPGVTILEASEAKTTYRINNFKENITIPISFASYLKEIGGIDEMAIMGILSEKVANIINNKLSQLGSEGKVEPLPNEQATGFTDEELISSLTALGIPVKDAENLLELVPRNLTLQEAIELALKKNVEIIAQQHGLES